MNKLNGYIPLGKGPRCKYHLANYQGPYLTWFLPLLWPSITFLLILLFGPCIINTLSKFISWKVQKIQFQMILQKGYQPVGYSDNVISFMDISCYIVLWSPTFLLKYTLTESRQREPRAPRPPCTAWRSQRSHCHFSLETGFTNAWEGK